MTDYIALARECGAWPAHAGAVTITETDLAAFAARIAKAAPEDEPVAWAYQETLDGLRETGFLYSVELWREPGARADLVPLYLAPHAVAPPEAASAPEDATMLALQRVTHSYRMLLSGKPVRDVSETLAEADAAIAAAQKEPTP